jgi:ribokinase
MTKKIPKICVVGSANMDLLSKVPRLPNKGETLVGHYFQMGCGGKGSNQAVMAARLGAHVSMVARLGRDPLGEIMFKNYLEQGIDTRWVFWDEEHFSGVAPILVDDEGNNTITIVPGANMALSPDDVAQASDVIQSADVVICQLEIPIETTLRAFQIAKAKGILTILNPAPAAPIPDELIRLGDIIAPNETETTSLTGLPVETFDQAILASKELVARGARTVIITMGERGVCVLDEEGASHLPAFKVQAIDSTGAGDAFIGSLAYFLAQGQPIRDAIVASNAIAAISVTKVGTQVSFPSWNEISQFIGSVHHPDLIGLETFMKRQK